MPGIKTLVDFTASISPSVDKGVQSKLRGEFTGPTEVIQGFFCTPPVIGWYYNVYCSLPDGIFSNWPHFLSLHKTYWENKKVNAKRRLIYKFHLKSCWLFLRVWKSCLFLMKKTNQLTSRSACIQFLFKISPLNHLYFGHDNRQNEHLD